MVDLERWSQLGGGAGVLAAAAESPAADARASRARHRRRPRNPSPAAGAARSARLSRCPLPRAAKRVFISVREVNPDLIFLDVAMSGMTGIDVLDFVRSQRMDVAVILTTAYSSEQVAIAALRHGADDYLRKPFDRGEFQATLDRTLARLTMSRQIKLLRRELEKKQAQLAHELARAAALQSELLPTEHPPLAGFEIGARCLPARAVGGDFYDWQQLAEGDAEPDRRRRHGQRHVCGAA